MPAVGYRKNVKAALPGTYDEIAKKACVSKDTVKRWLKRLRADGECHIGKWKRSLDTRGHYQPQPFGQPHLAGCVYARYTIH